MASREYQEHAKKTVKAINKTKTKDFVQAAKSGSSSAKKVLAMAKKPHKAKKAYMLSVKKEIKGK